jgi:hypothetical protein
VLDEVFVLFVYLGGLILHIIKVLTNNSIYHVFVNPKVDHRANLKVDHPGGKNGHPKVPFAKTVVPVVEI